MKTELLSIFPDNTPAIINEASKSTLSILVLLILGLLCLSAFYFRKSREIIKVGVFAIILIVTIVFGYIIIGKDGRNNNVGLPTSMDTLTASTPSTKVSDTIKKASKLNYPKPLQNLEPTIETTTEVKDNHGVLNSGTISGPITINN